MGDNRISKRMVRFFREKIKRVVKLSQNSTQNNIHDHSSIVYRYNIYYTQQLYTDAFASFYYFYIAILIIALI